MNSDIHEDVELKYMEVLHGMVIAYEGELQGVSAGDCLVPLKIMVIDLDNCCF